jgi:ADP-ribose pyrophosphatase YjhB (NUDIX family)
VTFVRQERGPYAGWWLLPGGKVEPHPTDMPILDDAAAAAYPGELIAGRLARSGSPDQPSDRRDLRPADDVPGR